MELYYKNEFCFFNYNICILLFFMDILCDDVILEIINYLSTIFNISLVCKKTYNVTKKSELCYLKKYIKYINPQIYKNIKTNKIYKLPSLKKVTIIDNDRSTFSSKFMYQSDKYIIFNHSMSYLYVENDGFKYETLYIDDIMLNLKETSSLYPRLCDICKGGIKKIFPLYSYIYIILNNIDRNLKFETNIRYYCKNTDNDIMKYLEDNILKKFTKLYRECRIIKKDIFDLFVAKNNTIQANY